MKFIKQVSGGILTLIPEGRVFYSVEEYEKLDAELKQTKDELLRWKWIAQGFYGGLSNIEQMEDAKSAYERAVNDERR